MGQRPGEFHVESDVKIGNPRTGAENTMQHLNLVRKDFRSSLQLSRRLFLHLWPGISANFVALFSSVAASRKDRRCIDTLMPRLDHMKRTSVSQYARHVGTVCDFLCTCSSAAFQIVPSSPDRWFEDVQKKWTRSHLFMNHDQMVALTEASSGCQWLASSGYLGLLSLT